MTYQEVLEHAREAMAPRCAVCRVCDGRACAGRQPGPGGKGTGATAKRNVSWPEEHVKLHQRVVREAWQPICETELFGKTFALPVFPAPIGMLELNYGPALTEYGYSKIILQGARQGGTIAFTGGGKESFCFFDPLRATEEEGGWAIPTLKPWNMELVAERLHLAEQAGVPAFAMDLDTAGLPHAAGAAEPMVFKSRAELEQIASMTKLPFLVKGVMTAEDALLAAEAGAYGIVVSNHGGRVLDHGLSTAEVLPEIRQAVGDRIKVLADGGIRSGVGVFKMLALGADAVLVGRPYAIAAYGGGVEGVALYTEKLRAELLDTMTMTGCRTLADIDRTRIRLV